MMDKNAFYIELYRKTQMKTFGVNGFLVLVKRDQAIDHDSRDFKFELLGRVIELAASWPSKGQYV